MKCQACGNENKENAKFCFKCGGKLLYSSPPNIKEREEAIKATTPVKVVDDLSTAPLSRAWLLFNEDGTEITIPYKTEVLIGRLDIDSGNNPDIDLTEIDKNKVTSRKHALIIYSQGKYKLRDMRSMNGTFLNGKRLEHNLAYQLKNEDEILLGKLGCTFRCID